MEMPDYGSNFSNEPDFFPLAEYISLHNINKVEWSRRESLMLGIHYFALIDLLALELKTQLILHIMQRVSVDSVNRMCPKIQCKTRFLISERSSADLRAAFEHRTFGVWTVG